MHITQNLNLYYNLITYKKFFFSKYPILKLFFGYWNFWKKKQFKQFKKKFYSPKNSNSYRLGNSIHIEFYVNSTKGDIRLNKKFIKIRFTLYFFLNICINYTAYLQNTLNYSLINFFYKPNGLTFTLKEPKRVKLLNKNYKLL